MKKFIAKLHLWLAVPFGIVISLLCLTGAILVFESELKELTNPALYKASARSGQTMPFDELVRTVKTQVPDTVGISSIQVPSSAGKNYRLGIEGTRRTTMFVDPYTGEVKGVSLPYAKGEFFTFVRRLHRWFLLQVQGPGISWGKLITGTSTLVFVIIIVSGMIIWIPKTWKGAKQRLSIKRGKGRFRFWHDFHLSLGQMAALILLMMTLTGLTWSFNWYRDGFYKVFGVEVTQGGSGGHGGAQPAPSGQREESNRSGERQQEVDGEVREGRGNRSEGAEGRGGSNRPEGEIGERTEGRGNRGGGEGRPEGRGVRPGADSRKYVVWEKAVTSVMESNPGFRSLSVQDGSISVTLSNYGNTRAADRYTFDNRSGEITGVDYYRDQPKSAKIRGWIYAVHVGSWGGWITRVIYFIVCLIGAALPVTGYYIWLKKRWKKWHREKTA